MKGSAGSLMDYSSDFCQMSSVFPQWPVRSCLNGINVLQSNEIKVTSVSVSPSSSSKQLCFNGATPSKNHSEVTLIHYARPAQCNGSNWLGDTCLKGNSGIPL